MLATIIQMSVEMAFFFQAVARTIGFSHGFKKSLHWETNNGSQQESSPGTSNT